MKIARVFSDAEGGSRLSDIEIELFDEGMIGRISQPMPATAVMFRQNDSNYDYDWHVAPRRQFVVLLDGSIEIETSDGAKRSFHGGDVILLEDTTGRGHRTRNLEPIERRSLFIALEP